MDKPTPIQFTVPDMDCQGCVASITAAVRRIDAQASVAADLDSKHVTIGSAAGADAIAAAIEDAGFTISAV